MIIGAQLQAATVQIESRLVILVFEGVVPNLLTVDGCFQRGHLGVIFRGQLPDLHPVIRQNTLASSLGQQQLAQVGMSVVLSKVQWCLAVPISRVEDHFSLQQIFRNFMRSIEAGNMERSPVFACSIGIQVNRLVNDIFQVVKIITLGRHKDLFCFGKIPPSRVWSEFQSVEHLSPQRFALLGFLSNLNRPEAEISTLMCQVPQSLGILLIISSTRRGGRSYSLQ